jgi:hypothetical protein
MAAKFAIEFAKLFAEQWDCSKEYSPTSDFLEIPF